MSTPPFHVFDTMLGDRVIDGVAVTDLLQGASTSAFASPPPIGATTPNEGHFSIFDADRVTINGGMYANGDAHFNDTFEASGSSVFSGIVEFTDRVISTFPLLLSPGVQVATAGAATIDGKASGVITSEPLTTAPDSTYVLTVTNDAVQDGDIVHASVAMGTATKGLPILGPVQVTAGSFVATVLNADSTDALNGTIKVAFVIFRGDN